MGPGGMMGGPPMGRPPMGPPPGGRPPKDMPFGGKPPRPQAPADDFTDREFDLEQMEQESEEMVRLVSLTRENCRFIPATDGSLTMIFNKHTYEHTELVETFPFTDRYAFISVRDPAQRDKELGMIEQLHEAFDSETVAIIKKHLDLRYHMPVIEKFVQVKESGGFTHFTVQTDCGETQFSLKANSSCITALTQTRLIIQDLEGKRFEIPDKDRLTAKELKRLDVFM